MTNLNYTFIWGCAVKVRIYNPQLKKLNLKASSGYLIGYIMNSKGYMHYYPYSSTGILEVKNVKFLENLSLE